MKLDPFRCLFCGDNLCTVRNEDGKLQIKDLHLSPNQKPQREKHSERTTVLVFDLLEVQQKYCKEIAEIEICAWAHECFADSGSFFLTSHVV